MLRLSSPNKGFGLILPISLAFVGAAAAFYEIFGESKDSQIYLQYFDYMISKPSCFGEGIFNFEIGFETTSCFVSSILKSSTLVYSFFVFVSLLLKLIVLFLTLLNTKSSKLNIKLCSFLSVFLYFSRFFPLHELTQIRASLSIAFILVGSLLLLQGSNLNKQVSKINPFALLMYFIAFLFHISSILILPFLLISFYIKSRKDIIVYSIIIFIFIKLFFLQILVNFGVELNPRLNEYVDAPIYLQPVSLFSPRRGLDVFLIIIGLRNFNSQKRYYKFYLSVFTFSIISLYSLMDTPVFAHRLSEIMQVFGVLLVAVMRYKSQLIFTIPYVVIVSFLSIYAFFYTDEFFG
ncbi:EpsG family protein [Dulcicalothrix desertica]|nr:EpsG family protein [Dulcicalothrix desertica]TWH40671.1 EpsG-like putative glucosyltransferase [Dulcicalothrix desertica PCC 7102]